VAPLQELAASFARYFGLVDLEKMDVVTGLALAQVSQVPGEGWRGEQPASGVHCLLGGFDCLPSGRQRSWVASAGHSAVQCPAVASLAGPAAQGSDRKKAEECGSACAA
jgi:hypothetical protein